MEFLEFFKDHGSLRIKPRDKKHMSQCMRFPTMWYVRPAKSQISLRASRLSIL